MKSKKQILEEKFSVNIEIKVKEKTNSFVALREGVEVARADNYTVLEKELRNLPPFKLLG